MAHLYTANGFGVLVQSVEANLWNSRVWVFAKYIMEFALQRFLNLRGRVHIHISLQAKIESPDVIQASHMVLVFVGKQDGIDRIDLFPQHLLSEVWACINHQMPRTIWSIRPIHIKHRTGTQPAVTGI